MVNDPFLTDEIARMRGLAERINRGQPVRPEHTETVEVPADAGLSSAHIDRGES